MRTLRYHDFIDPADNVTIHRQFCHYNKSSQNPHDHEFIELAYCYEGEGVQILDGREYPMSRGTLLFLNYGQSHSFYSEYGMRYYDFLLTPSFISESLITSVDALSLLSLATFSDMQPSDIPPIIRMSGREMLETEYIAERMDREFSAKKPGYRAVISGYMTVIFSMLFRKMTLPDESDGTASKRFDAAGVIGYIEEHLSEKISLSELARRSFYNPSYFSRLFKEYTGQSLTDFIHKKRMEWAAGLLESTDKSIGQISAAVGYSDIKQFYKQFKQYTGSTPGAIRRSSAGK